MDLQRKDREVGYPDYLTDRRRERDRVPRHESIRLAERELQGRSDAQRSLRRLQGSLGEVVRCPGSPRDPCAEAVKHKRRRLSESAANLFGGFPPNRATRAVIGTLRPTERRRAAFKFSKKQWS